MIQRIKHFLKSMLRSARLFLGIESKTVEILPTLHSAYWGCTTKPEQAISHTGYLLPSDCQGQVPACAGFCLANLLEWKLARNGVDICGFQLDGFKIWNMGNEQAGNEGVGLSFSQVFRGVKGSLIPEESGHRMVTPLNLFKELQRSPVYAVVRLTNKWVLADSRTGLVPPSGLWREPHACLLCGVDGLSGSDGGPIVRFLNSWGPSNGRAGVVALTWNQFVGSMIEAWAVDFDEKAWVESGIWRDWLVPCTA